MIVERRLWVIPARPIVQADRDSAAANNSGEIEQREGAAEPGHLEVTETETNRPKIVRWKNDVLPSDAVIDIVVGEAENQHYELELTQNVTLNIETEGALGDELLIVFNNTSGGNRQVTPGFGFHDTSSFNITPGNKTVVYYKVAASKYFEVVRKTL